VNTTQNDTVRQTLSTEYNKVLQQTKLKMMRVYINTQQAKAEEIQYKFDQIYAEMKENLRTGPLHKKFTPTMISLLKQRLKNIKQHLKHIYDLKIRCFQSKSVAERPE
jgi:hypothetical protein